MTFLISVERCMLNVECWMFPPRPFGVEHSTSPVGCSEFKVECSMLDVRLNLL